MDETVPAVPINPPVPPAPDNRLKIVAVVAAVVFLSLVGGGAFFLMNSKKTSAAPVPVITPTTPSVVPVAPVKPTIAQPVNQIRLNLTKPGDKVVSTKPTIVVAGQTVPNADVSVNEVDLKADAAGNFSTTIRLDEGDNPIIVNAFDANGNMAEQEISVTYQTQ